jgi:hypothetical protein
MPSAPPKAADLPALLATLCDSEAEFILVGGASNFYNQLLLSATRVFVSGTCHVVQARLIRRSAR